MSSLSGVGVLDKAMSVVRALEREGPLTLARLQVASALPRATAHRLAVALEAHGLVLGIEVGQGYEDVRGQLDRGDAIVLYTDGVIEARCDGVLYGPERLDAFLGKRASSPPEELAHEVLNDCRAFAEGELADDCAVVVVRRV